MNLEDEDFSVKASDPDYFWSDQINHLRPV